ncbi:lysophospholipid acyltransferase family protein [Rhizobium sp. 32-5/1]|uniref:lysophospholipid acyltransferase family protein n=1 Tax=Rhizobium sp. 32-5/1 TaxID=3019602 RepID=UPI00240DBAC9|nr:lysophospholipid acyltransferase family protein [Rhizobium sp. 32-5/1]WEZ83853.1 lysophospholipid acyltransferase family protein [Rhizobium sp. 32-5/1]
MTGENIAKRKAWVVPKHPPRPGLRALFGGPAGRAAFKHYWFKEGPGNALDISFYFALKLLPLDVCSDFGSWVGRFAIPRWFKTQERRVRENLRRLRPDLDDDARDALFMANCDAQGRLLTEYSIVSRIAATPGRIVRHNTDQILNAVSQGPVILACLHLGNWEVMGPELVSMGVVPRVNYAPPPRRGRAWIVDRVRQQGGVQLLPPGHSSMRPAVKELKAGGVLLQFCDEGFRGKLRGPLFGRKPHLEGNLAVIARLARMTGARICPIYTLRTHKANFTFHCETPFTLPPDDGTGDRLLEDIKLINSVIEPIVHANLEQWYFLDNEIPTDGK